MLADRTARWAGWWLIATMLAVFPANVNMAVDAERFDDIPEPLLWARLPLQAAIVYWIWRVAVRAALLRAPDGDDVAHRDDADELAASTTTR